MKICHTAVKRALLIALALLMLCGCAPRNGLTGTEPDSSIDTAPISEGRHDREPDYMAAFRTHMLIVGSLSVHMENDLFDEEQLRACARTVRDDLTRIQGAAGAESGETTVFLVTNTLYGCPAAVGSHVFCTVDDVESGAYREALIGAAYGLPAAWQRAGLAEYVFGEADDSALGAYYADGRHGLTASCSAIHLSPILSDEETVRAARATARSLTAFILEGDGLAAFREAADLSAVLDPWARSVGLSKVPVLPENSGAVASMALHAERGCLCVVKVDRFSIYLTEDSWARDPDTLYSWICAFLSGMDLVLDAIRTEAPSAAAEAESRYAKSVSITLVSENGMSYSYPGRNEVYLSKPVDSWHEMVHLLLEEPEGCAWLDWECEAVAEHFSYEAATRYAPTHTISDGWGEYLAFFADVSGTEPTDDDLVFHTGVWNLYRAFCAPDAVGYDDQAAYFRAYGIASLLLEGEIDRHQIRYKYDASISAKRQQSAGRKSADGNALSYPEATVMLEYLASIYGTDAVVDAYLRAAPLDRAFGITYAELFADARAYYAGLYGDLLTATD